MGVLFYKKGEFLNDGNPDKIDSQDLLKNMLNRNEMHKYKKLPVFRNGSVVKLTSTLPTRWNQHGQMDKFLGATKTIKSTQGTRVYFTEDEIWFFRISDIDEVITY